MVLYLKQRGRQAEAESRLRPGCSVHGMWVRSRGQHMLLLWPRGAVRCLRSRRVASTKREARIRALRARRDARRVRGGDEADASVSHVKGAAIIAVQPG